MVELVIGLLAMIGVVLLTGMLSYIIAPLVKLPELLLLLLTGIFFSATLYHGTPLLLFPPLFVNIVSTLAIIFIVLDGTTGVRIFLFDTPTMRSLKLVLWCAVFTFTIIPFVFSSYLGFSLTGALLISALIFGVAIEATPFLHSRASQQLLTLLKTETIHRTVIALITPFLILDVAKALADQNTGTLLGSIASPLSTLVISAGTGILIGTILLRIAKRFTTTIRSPLIIIVGGIITYAFGELFTNGGVIAIVAYGLFLANSYVRERVVFLSTEKTFTKFLYSLICIIAGLTITPPTLRTVSLALFLFVIFTSTRALSLWFSTAARRLSIREYVYATLSTPRGAGTVSILLLIASTTVASIIPSQEISTILSIGLSFVIISLIISTIVEHSKLLPRRKENRTLVGAK